MSVVVSRFDANKVSEYHNHCANSVNRSSFSLAYESFSCQDSRYFGITQAEFHVITSNAARGGNRLMEQVGKEFSLVGDGQAHFIFITDRISNTSLMLGYVRVNGTTKYNVIIAQARQERAVTWDKAGMWGAGSLLSAAGAGATVGFFGGPLVWAAGAAIGVGIALLAGTAGKILVDTNLSEADHVVIGFLLDQLVKKKMLKQEGNTFYLNAQ